MKIKNSSRKKKGIVIGSVILFIIVIVLWFVSQERKEALQNLQQEETEKGLLETEEYLENIDKVVLRNLENIQNLYDSKDETQGLVNELDKSINVQINEKSEGIQRKLKEIHERIGQTQLDITDILNGVAEEQSSQMEKEKNVLIEGIWNAVEKTEQEVEVAKIELKELVEELQLSQDKRHQKTMSVLTDMEEGIQSAMEYYVEESISEIQSSFDAGNITLKENMISNFDGLNKVFLDGSKQVNDQFSGLWDTMQGNQIKTEQQAVELKNFLLENLDAGNHMLKESMLEKLGNLDTNVANHATLLSENMKNQFFDLDSTVNNNGQEIKNNIDVWMNNLSQQLTEVFQSVSEGKQLIASALTDKGVPADATESFANLANKIKLITNVNLTGEVKYTYHSHAGGCHGLCGGTMDRIASNAIGNGMWVKVYLCRSCRNEWSTTEHDQPGTRPCHFTVNKCGKTESTIEKAEIIFHSTNKTSNETSDMLELISSETEAVPKSSEVDIEKERVDKMESESEVDSSEEMEIETGIETEEIKVESEEIKDIELEDKTEKMPEN